MTVVTLAEAREQLPELLSRAAAGEQIVIADGDMWLAALGAPPPQPPTAEEEAAAEAQRLAKALEGLRQTARWCVEDGIVLAPDDPLRAFLEPETPAA